VEHRHRFLVPAAAGAVSQLLSPFVGDTELRDRLSFYAVNFVLVWATGLLVFLILEKLGLSWALSLLGVSIFLTSRFTIASAALPVIDSAYFLAIALIVYLTLERRVLLLACLMPLLGYALNRKTQRYPVPLFLQLILPIAVGFAVLNGNLGIMLQAAFVPVIVYALIFVEHCMSRSGEEPS